MIALRTLTRNHVVSMFPPKLLALLINANDRCFGCPRGYPREPPGHAPPAFLFLSSTMSNSGEDLLTLRSDASGTNRYRSPLGRYRQLLASCIRNAHRNVDADERRASLSGGVIGGTRRECQASCRKFFALAKTPWKAGLFICNAMQKPIPRPARIRKNRTPPQSRHDCDRACLG